MGFLSEIFGHPRRSNKPKPINSIPKEPIVLSNTPYSSSIPKLIALGVNPIGMSYWRNINQHKDSDLLRVFLSVNDSLVEYTISKNNLEVLSERQLGINHTGEGCFYSALWPNILYIPYDDHVGYINTNTFEKGFATDLVGYKIWQCHSDFTEKIWSMTLKNDNYEIIGWGVWNNGRFTKYNLKGAPDECQIDKSGQWLLIKENNYNRIIYLPTGVERIISNEGGALGHSDIGFGRAIGENDMSQYGGALDRIDFTNGSILNIYSTGIWNMGYVSWTDAPNVNCLITTPTELILVNTLTKEGKVICPNMSQSDTYESRSKANLCPQGEYAVWTAYVDGSLNAYIVKI